jgi:nucleotide-binding universal stress UspA family protein
MFRRILFPTDGTEESLKAAETIAPFVSRILGSNITVLATTESGPHSTSDSPENRAREARLGRACATCAIRDASSVFHNFGIPFYSTVAEGESMPEAVEHQIARGEHDLVIMGSREFADEGGAGPSIIDQIIHTAGVPVIVLPQP